MHPALKRQDRLGKDPFAGFGTVVEDITESGYTKNQPISWALFEKTRFLCFYIIKSMARKGYFGPKSDFKGSKIPPRGASST